MEAIISHVVDIGHVLSSSDMHFHIIRHIVVYHRLCYGYHGVCNGYHHCERMMITGTCPMINVTYSMIYHYMSVGMIVHVWWFDSTWLISSTWYGDGFHGVASVHSNTVKCHKLGTWKIIYKRARSDGLRSLVRTRVRTHLIVPVCKWFFKFG